jgi:two-component system, OmpR family, response regulator
MSTSSLKSILYVDDESDIREIVEISLERIGPVIVRTCESGEAALKLLSQFKPELILLDVMMPGMDGPTTLKNIRARRELALIPIIFMTAKAMPQEVARFKQLGAIEVIAKPFDAMRLATRIMAIWNEHCAAITAPPRDARLDEIAARFIQRSLAEVFLLRERFANADVKNAAVLNEARHIAHRMNGSGATLGFDAISEAASKLEAVVEEGPKDSEIHCDFRKRCLLHLDNLELTVQRVAS